MMCGLCVEACPFDAIEMGHDYELARIDPTSSTIELLADVPAAKPKRAAPPSPRAPAEPRRGAEPARRADAAPKEVTRCLRP